MVRMQKRYWILLTDICSSIHFNDTMVHIEILCYRCLSCSFIIVVIFWYVTQLPVVIISFAVQVWYWSKSRNVSAVLLILCMCVCTVFAWAYLQYRVVSLMHSETNSCGTPLAVDWNPLCSHNISIVFWFQCVKW
jgi:hypothetical protein